MFAWSKSLLLTCFFFLRSTSAELNVTSTKMVDVKALAQAYFEAWNAQDLEKLGIGFHDDVTLRDWDVSASGRQPVVDANGGIFKAVPAIKIEVLNIFPSTNEKTGTH